MSVYKGWLSAKINQQNVNKRSSSKRTKCPKQKGRPRASNFVIFVIVVV